MDIEYVELPFPHLIIHNWYSDSELERIWKEIDFLTSESKLESPENTGGALDPHSQTNKKNNYGLFLYEQYNNPKVSDIITLTTKLFDENFVNRIIGLHWIFRYVKYSTKDTILLSYYENDSYYQSHFDTAMISACINLYKEPQKFTGGDLVFTEFDYKIKTENNRMIIFPSLFLHAVTPVKMNENSRFTGNGRYTITHFISTKS